MHLNIQGLSDTPQATQATEWNVIACPTIDSCRADSPLWKDDDKPVTMSRIKDAPKVCKLQSVIKMRWLASVITLSYFPLAHPSDLAFLKCKEGEGCLWGGGPGREFAQLSCQRSSVTTPNS